MLICFLTHLCKNLRSTVYMYMQHILSHCEEKNEILNLKKNKNTHTKATLNHPNRVKI